jgi:hypothetical protein
MPDPKTLQRVRADRRAGKAPSTQAAEYIREEMDHIHETQQGARSARQALAIGLSRARRAGAGRKAGQGRSSHRGAPHGP